MQSFQVHLTRYRGHERRISVAIHLQAGSFADAVRVANNMVEGLKQGDPEAEFEIVSVEATGYSGVRCDGSRWFETAEELSARVTPAA